MDKNFFKFLLALLFGVNWALAQNPPIIQDFPRKIKNNFLLLESGISTELDCESTSDPKPEINWFKDGQKIELNSVPGLEVDGSLLKWTNPDPSIQTGYYHCEAANAMGLAKSAVIHVSPDQPAYPEYVIRPEFSLEPKLEIQPIGKDVTFKCAARGNPEPEIIWTKNGQEIEGTRNQEYVTFENIDEKEIGTYACNATNEGGYVYKIVLLNILNDEPRFVETPRDIQAAIGQEVIFRCSGKGYPEPKITWFFNNEEIDFSNEMNLMQAKRGDLIIAKVTNSSAGVYRCDISNEYGSRNAEGELVVVSTTTISNGPVDRAAEIRSEVRMPCTVLWDPQFDLTVTWKKDNMNIDLQNSDRIQKDDEDNALIIRNLEFEDEGLYTCVASTRQGSAATSGALTVTGIPPKLVFGPSAQIVTDGSTVTLLCTVDSFPPAEHTWFKDTERIKFDDPRFTMTPEGSLIIHEAKESDSDKYICRADNTYGQPVIESAFIDVRQATRILSQSESMEFFAGQNYSLDCLVQVDPRLESALNITWTKDGKAIDFQDNDHYSVDENNTLLITDVSGEEVGEYACAVRTPVDEVVLRASIYTQAGNWWWLIILLILLCALIILLCIVICVVRKRSKRKGRYGVKDIEDGKGDTTGKHNKSEIQYSIDGTDEDDLLEGSLLEGDKPIVKKNSSNGKKTTTPVAAGLMDDNMRGSENSLLNYTDEELWLRRGMDEDGSFREGKYADGNV